MVDRSEKKRVEDRRDFLKLASLGTLAGGAALATGSAAQAAVAEEDTGSGYRETEHVRKFYELAKF